MMGGRGSCRAVALTAWQEPRPPATVNSFLLRTYLRTVGDWLILRFPCEQHVPVLFSANGSRIGSQQQPRQCPGIGHASRFQRAASCLQPDRGSVYSGHLHFRKPATRSDLSCRRWPRDQTAKLHWHNVCKLGVSSCITEFAEGGNGRKFEIVRALSCCGAAQHCDWLFHPARFRHAPHAATVCDCFSIAIDPPASGVAVAVSIYRLEWASTSGNRFLISGDYFAYFISAKDEGSEG
jgi:hypothetical protein